MALHSGRLIVTRMVYVRKEEGAHADLSRAKVFPDVEELIVTFKEQKVVQGVLLTGKEADMYRADMRRRGFVTL